MSIDATENQLEYIAEVEAMIQSNIKVSKRAMKLYNELMEGL
ncbi:MAG: hypothetical protein N3A69_07190 [Leptospiraceae bacterium]|nr:hypothetical protein [Leptospiraceae bacterium]